MSAKEVIDFMKSHPVFKDADLSYITDELLEKRKGGAKALPSIKSLNTGGPTIVMVNYSGNHPTISSTTWTWEDTPGSQCGQTVVWTHRVSPGESYGVGGNCPQGYPWYNFNVYS